MFDSIIFFILPIPLAFILDVYLGDPRWLYHPVRIIGNGISWMERQLRCVFPATPAGERCAGVVLSACIPLASGLVMLAILALCWKISPWLSFAVETFACYQMLAVNSLRAESMAVYDRLYAQDLPGARNMVGRIVGRDTNALDEAGVARATVETIAENTSDGVIAPMLFMALGGAPLCYLYKGINTLDSMVGYKNDRYLHFGRASALLDDFANYLPARISAQFMIWAAQTAGFDAAQAKRIYLRDRQNHTSPNSAHTEAVCAGALGLQLGGDSVYFGKVVHKPTIGDATRPIEMEDIPRANHLMTTTSLICLGVCVAFRCGLFALFSLA